MFSFTSSSGTRCAMDKKIHRDKTNLNIVASIVNDEDVPQWDLYDLGANLTIGNHTDFDQLKCHLDHLDTLTNFSGCGPTHDRILCWPPTKINSLAIQPCFNEWNGVLYSTEENATKFCRHDGVWEKSYYDLCINTSSGVLPTQDVEYTTIIYCTGYVLSILALTVAVIIFFHFKELRCLRNTIHCNLFFTYIFSALLWLMTLSFQMSSSAGMTESRIECMALLAALHFFNLTNFFWMMVEGLYLYLLVVETFSRIEVINKFAIYAVIGYGVPGVCALSWSVVKIIVSQKESVHEASQQLGCPYMQESSIDWIFKVPACLVLIINLVFLFSIMWVLITKLRSANTAETRQYRKASKALLVLIPLFGLTYLIVLYGPNEGIGKKIFDIARAVLLSTQGFSVALFYCFFNSEVKRAIKNRMNRWRDARNIRNSQFRQTQLSRSRFTKNGINRSPQSRTESLRPLTCNIQKRESNVTTTTIVTEIPASYTSCRGSNGALQLSSNPRAVSPLMKGLVENSV